MTITVTFNDRDSSMMTPAGHTTVCAAQCRGADATFIVGASRSGTTWLGKIFDSHPEVLYRHEPDRHLSGDQLLGHSSEAMLARFAADRSLRSAGKLPLFRKTGIGPIAHAWQTGYVAGLRALARMGIGVTAMVPEFTRRSRPDGRRLVVKSVRPNGCLGVAARHLAGSRVIVILRHPCGQVASLMQGAQAGKFSSAQPIDLDLAEAFAAQCGEPRRWRDMPAVAQYAWNWAAFADTCFRELDGHPQVRLVRYEDLCANPMAEARRLFAFAGLSWSEQTARFIARSTSSGRADGYYGVYRTSTERPKRWRTSLSAAEQAEVTAIARRSGFGHFWPGEDRELEAGAQDMWARPIGVEGIGLQTA